MHSAVSKNGKGKTKRKGGAIYAMAAVRCAFVRNAENVPRALKLSECRRHKSPKGKSPNGSQTVLGGRSDEPMRAKRRGTHTARYVAVNMAMMASWPLRRARVKAVRPDCASSTSKITSTNIDNCKKGNEKILKYMR